MTHIYLACYALQADVDAQRDDNDMDLEQMSAPQVSHIWLTAPTPAQVNVVREDIEDEYCDLMEIGRLAPLEWKYEAFTETTLQQQLVGRHLLFHKAESDDPVAMLQIFKREINQ